MIEIEYHLYEQRQIKKMSLRELSKKSDVSKTQINDIENGNTHPTILTLCQLAEALELKPEDLYSYTVL